MVKVISLSEEAYNKLKGLKRDLSFSQIVLELIEDKIRKRAKDFYGLISKEDGSKWMKEVKKNRESQKVRKVNF